MSEADRASRAGPLLQMIQDPSSGEEVIGVKSEGLTGITGYVECDGRRLRRAARPVREALGVVRTHRRAQRGGI